MRRFWDLLIDWVLGDEKRFSDGMRTHPWFTICKILSILALSCGAVYVTAYLIASATNRASKEPEKTLLAPYTQTIQQNTPDGEFNYLDIGGKGILVPLLSESIQAAIAFGEMIGEPNTIYNKRVVVMALDPSTRYSESKSGISQGTGFDPENLYTFYIADGVDITDESKRWNIIPIGEERYKVTLLTIDGRGGEINYTFRVEELEN